MLKKQLNWIQLSRKMGYGSVSALLLSLYNAKGICVVAKAIQVTEEVAKKRMSYRMQALGLPVRNVLPYMQDSNLDRLIVDYSNTRYCQACKKNLPLSEFYVSKLSGRYDHQCKECSKNRVRSLHATRRESKNALNCVCGRPPSIYEDGNKCSVTCIKCPASTTWYRTTGIAIAAWNKLNSECKGRSPDTGVVQHQEMLLAQEACAAALSVIKTSQVEFSKEKEHKILLVILREISAPNQ